MAKALGFYCDLLGLRVAREADESGDYIDRVTGLSQVQVRTVKMRAPSGGTLVELLEYVSHRRERPEAPEACAIGASHVAFTVRDLAATQARLSAAGVPFHAAPQTSPDGYARVAYCRDPDGTIVELVEVVATA
jgi:catechol 2,3-dioxygenase-like lactoylglutathione lyase family enzyme